MKLPLKKRASPLEYISPQQIILPGFESPFTQKLDANNRWIVLSHKIPWNTIAGIYKKQMSSSSEGRPALSPRLVIGALIIKHLNNWSDEETILQIQENMYLQYFVGFSSFTTSSIFDSSLFVEIRKRMGDEQINSINEQIVKLHFSSVSDNKTPEQKQANGDKNKDEENKATADKAEPVSSSDDTEPMTHHGRIITDAIATPQDIAYPTDLNLLSTAREKTEQLIDFLYDSLLHKKKPRTYRKTARKDFLNLARKKNCSGKAIRKAIGKQLNYVKRNLKNINKLQDVYEVEGKNFPLAYKHQRYLWIIETFYAQQKHMHSTFTHSVEDRIVSIHQPHVRPIVRGKTNAKVEFGAKIEVTIANGFDFLDDLSWDAFNEGSRLIRYVEKYKTRFGYYPKEILADQIFCSRENRRKLKELGIKLMAKPLGRPSATAVKEYVRPGERNPIEGKFGQGKTAYGLDRIKARLKETSQSWIASIILVLNLVKLAGLEKYAIIIKIIGEIKSIQSANVIYFSILLKMRNAEFLSKP